MASRRGKSQAKRNSGGGLPGWAWLVLGLALGIGAFLLAPQFLGGDGSESFFRPKPNPDAQPPAMDAGKDDAIVADDGDAATSKTQDYDFYTLLPGEETEISDAELARRAQAEQARERELRLQQERELQALAEQVRKERDNGATPPPAIDAGGDGATANPDAADPATSAVTASAPDSAITRPTVVGDGARYILQAGAFAASGDAEALKAKIAFLGLSARVESAQIKGKTVYRVRMGPYGTASELAEAKQKLASGGLPAMAVKAK